ncbi:unnamed protein product, partial [Strongylus vulgaris]
LGKTKQESGKSGQISNLKGKRDYHKDSKLESWRLIIKNLPYKFTTREAAEKARDYLNSNKFQGRMVTAGWVLPKDTRETAAQEEREQLKKKVFEDDANLKEEKPELSNDEDVDAESDSDEVESGSKGEDDYGNRKEENEKDEGASDEDIGNYKFMIGLLITT